MNAEERLRTLREVELAGNCSHPIRLSGEMVNLATGEVARSSLRISCKDRRHVVCPSCSYLYRTDAWILVSTGLVGGKGTPKEVSTHPRLFITVTAPSFGPVHTMKARGECVGRSKDLPGRSSEHVCAHSRARACGIRHEESSPELGRPLCDQCFDYEGAVLWNAHAAKLWNNTIQSIRRSLAEAGGLNQRNLKSVAQVHYLKVAELQRRGLVHFHIVLRADGPSDIGEPAPAWLSIELLRRVVRQSIRKSSVVAPNRQDYRWGQLLDVQDLGVESHDTGAVASYLAKYVTKTTDGSTELAHRFSSRRQIESLVDDPHVRKLAVTSWNLAIRPELELFHLRDHAHTFGFTGLPITKSRDYSTTFAALRGNRATFMAVRNASDPVEGSFHYEGRGYDNPRSAELAEVFFTMRRELRQEGAQARRKAKRELHGDSL
jgi:hypothetical protein